MTAQTKTVMGRQRVIIIEFLGVASTVLLSVGVLAVVPFAMGVVAESVMTPDHVSVVLSFDHVVTL